MVQENAEILADSQPYEVLAQKEGVKAKKINQNYIHYLFTKNTQKGPAFGISRKNRTKNGALHKILHKI